EGDTKGKKGRGEIRKGAAPMASGRDDSSSSDRLSCGPISASREGPDLRCRALSRNARNPQRYPPDRRHLTCSELAASLTDRAPSTASPAPDRRRRVGRWLRPPSGVRGE